MDKVSVYYNDVKLTLDEMKKIAKDGKRIVREEISKEDAIEKEFTIVRRGKKNYYVLKHVK